MTSTPAAVAPRSDAAEPPASARIAVAALCFGGLSAALTQTMVIPLQAELPLLLNTTAANASWVVTITLLAAAVSMPLAGRLADLFGKQRVLVATAVLLVLGSIICAVGGSLAPVLIGRGLQGLAMGFIPVGISLIREITPPQMSATAIATMSATLGVGGAIGLPLAAWIADSGDWHTLFWVSAAVGTLVLISTWFLVPHVHDAHPGRLDVPGAVGLSVGLVLLLVGISKANDWGWGEPVTLGCIALGVVVLLGWGLFELRVVDPLVDLRTSARKPVLLTNLAGMAIGFGMMAQSIVVPQLLAMPEATGYGLGQSILAAGLWMAPGGLMMMVFAPLSGAITRRLGAKTTLIVGGTVLGIGYLVALGLMDAPWRLLIATCICSAGVGIGYAAMPTLILDAVPMHEAAAAVGLNGLTRSMGTTCAAAVMATVLTGATMSLGGFEVPTENAFRICFGIGAAAAFVGVAIAAAIPRAKA